MNMSVKVLVSASIVSMTAGAAFAQNTTFNNDAAAANAVEALEEQIVDDRDRDLGRFGNNGRRIGTYGSVSARATMTTDDGDSATDLGIGLRYGMFDGRNGYDVTLSYNYGSDDGEESQNNLLAGVDYRRNLSDVLFAYAKADLAFDKLADEAGDYSQDIFVGAGLGYRIYNSADTQWSLQVGPGYRVAQVVGGEDVREAAASLSSNYYHSLSNASYVTNDTDVIYSDAAMAVTNELALNVSMTQTLSLRTSLTTQYNDATDATFSDGRNTLGVSVVYNFN